MNIEGVKYKTSLTSKFERRKKWEIPDGTKVYSFIPGTVVKLFVNEGDKINAGDKLMVLEAMKMKNNISVPFCAKIKKINIAEGERIPKEHLLFEFELTED
ncbi:MAG: hypothetical protein A2W98_10085 [Bacteroidetes bacterium GWF2_33_38]|nr:MAG: hypothetical protein A2W98_10085 [Bacteroidetes bacterium GWF2_33_38]OFY76356.1 MAG: hypothetical protein A2265_11825 [Bacteroidetes bacterium RIFOXYA12_FULL_33_9]OFY89567.1 MAG: hypothetical protein A2236_05245 [Bacteroidetes bacterium RIFOXYA2_FULL_33_7]